MQWVRAGTQRRFAAAPPKPWPALSRGPAAVTRMYLRAGEGRLRVAWTCRPVPLSAPVPWSLDTRGRRLAHRRRVALPDRDLSITTTKSPQRPATAAPRGGLTLGLPSSYSSTASSPAPRARPSAAAPSFTDRPTTTFTIAEMRQFMCLVDPRLAPEFARVLAAKRVESGLADHWARWEWLPDNLLMLCMAIFTDGSAVLAPGAEPTGGWGFVVLAAGLDQHGKVHFGLAGAACGSVTATTGAQHFRGASSISAPTTEISALLEAFLGLHRVCGCRGGLVDVAALPPADIFVDCQFALDTVQMKCRASTSVELVHASRMLWAGLAPHPSMRKVPGHKGYVGNEFADIMAELGRANGYMSQFCFARAAGLRPAAAYIQDGLTARPDGQDGSRILQFWERMEGCADPRDEVVPRAAERTRPVKFGTANVLTMRPACEARAGASTRRLQLEGLFAHEKVTVCGLQEARGRHPADKEGEHYRMLSSAADARGNYGLELWLLKSWLRGRIPVHLVLSEPRRLLVVANTKCGDLALAVLHAVGAPAPDADIAAWWAATATALCAFAPGLPLVLLADANCHVGSVRSAAIGPCGAEHECAGGSEFHTLL